MKRCAQCWKEKPLDQFSGVRKSVVSWCIDCRKLYGTGGRRDTRRNGLAATELRVLFFATSLSPKLGNIPNTITSGETCPDACGLRDAGCYAEFGILSKHWRRAPTDGLTWPAFLERVRALPPGQLWRHNTAGDLPGNRDQLDIGKLTDLAHANRGRRGFTMTRKPLLTEQERRMVALANRAGFTINVTAHGLEDADAKAQANYEGITPVVVVLPADAPARLTTPAGRTVIVCPAQTRDDTTCADCQLCSRTGRSAIIGFRAHGQWKNKVSALVQLRPKAA